jgi:hypothetical protein
MSDVLASLAVKISAENQQFLKVMADTQKKFASSVAGIEKHAGSVGNTFKGMAGQIAGAFALDSLASFAGKMIDVTAEFQKFEAVLTNTLGSSSAAQAALTNIQEFAAKTPFGVAEITEEFIKLANRGILVTNEQLTKIGDVASALGKPLGKVNEAILDINNTERWNELGIKVQTVGDKMVGTFKGVSVEVDRTEQGALSMIETFGEMEGVAGGMAAISETLGGKLSNLSDNMDKLFNTLGQGTSGVLTWAIDKLNEYLEVITNAVKTTAQIDAEVIGRGVNEFMAAFKSLDAGVQKLSTQAVVSEINKLSIAFDEAAKNAKYWEDASGNIFNIGKANEARAAADNLKLQLDYKKAELEAIKGFYTEQQKLREAASAKEEKQRQEALEKLQAQQAKVLAGVNADLAQVERMNILFGDSYDYIGEKAAALQKGIETLVNNGFNMQGNAVQGMLSQLSSLGLDQQVNLGSIEASTNGADQFEILKAGASALAGTYNTELTPALMRVGEGIGSINVPAADTGWVMEDLNAKASEFAGITGTFEGLLGGVADAFLNTAMAGASFGEGVLQALSDFSKAFGKQLIALGIAKLALDKLFAFPGAAPIAIAAGIALMAASSALTSSLAKGPSLSGGAASISSPRTSITSAVSQNPVQITGETRIENKAIVIAYTNGTQNDKRTT